MSLLARLSAGLRNAFSLGPPGPARPTPEEAEVIDRVLRVVVRRGMTGPALLFLESSRPLSGVSAASIHYFAPFASALVDASALRLLADFLDRRGSIEFLCARLEELEAESVAAGVPDRYRANEDGAPAPPDEPDSRRSP